MAIQTVQLVVTPPSFDRVITGRSCNGFADVASGEVTLGSGQFSQIKQAVTESDFFDTVHQVVYQSIRNGITSGCVLGGHKNLVAATAINNGVCSISTINDIPGVPEASAFTALKIVTCEHIITRTAIKGVIAPTAKQLVVVGITPDHVVA